MPIYEFCCQDCQKEFEEFFHSASQKKDVSCAKCGSRNIKKKVSLFGLAGKNDNSGEFAPSSGGRCSSCATHNCGSCH